MKKYQSGMPLYYHAQRIPSQQDKSLHCHYSKMSICRGGPGQNLYHSVDGPSPAYRAVGMQNLLQQRSPFKTPASWQLNIT